MTESLILNAIGPYEPVSDFAHSHAYSTLTRVKAESGFYWIKRHKFPGKQAGEIHALRFWGPKLGRTPQMVAWSVDPMVLLLSEVDGQDAPPDALGVWSEAGEWLARMHAIEGPWLGAPDVDGGPQGKVDTDPVAHFEIAITTRLAEGKANEILNPQEVEFIERTARETIPALEGEPPRAVHRDFGPRNWLVKDGRLSGVIDFEHAVWGVRAMDLGRLSLYSFDENPVLGEAFFEGYGQVSSTLASQIAAGRLLHALGGLVFAVRVEDAEFEQMNRAALRRLMSEPG